MRAGTRRWVNVIREEQTAAPRPDDGTKRPRGPYPQPQSLRSLLVRAEACGYKTRVQLATAGVWKTI